MVKQHNFIDRLLNEPSGDITATQALEGSFPLIDELDDDGRLLIVHICTDEQSIGTYFVRAKLFLYYFLLFCFAFNSRKTAKLTADYFSSALNTLFFLYIQLYCHYAQNVKLLKSFLIGKRLEEEIPMLEQEMVRCLKHYRDKVMPSLTSGLNTLDKGMWFFSLSRAANFWT